jgi:hypothetical protein
MDPGRMSPLATYFSFGSSLEWAGQNGGLAFEQKETTSTKIIYPFLFLRRIAVAPATSIGRDAS